MLTRAKPLLVGAILIMAFWLEFGAGVASGAAFRLSFLDQEGVLTDTCQLLSESGFSAGSVATFRKLVEHHNRKGNRVDRTRFPTPREGYYEFRELSDLTNRLQTLLHWTPSERSLDQRTFTCFDVACLLLRGAGCGCPDFENDLQSKGVVLSTNGLRTFRSDYCWTLFPEPDYEYLVGQARSEAETRLLLSVRVGREITGPDPGNEIAWRGAFATFVRGMKESGFAFPQRFKLGLGFYVSVKTRYFGADHAFICSPKRGRMICLEKNGSPGPYVRAEFESEQDVARYMSWQMLEDAKDPKLNAYGRPVLVSLNDRLLGVYIPDMRL